MKRDFCRQQVKWGSQFCDSNGGIVQAFVAGRVDEPRFRQLAIPSNRDVEHQRPVDFVLFCNIWIIQSSDSLHRESIFWLGKFAFDFFISRAFRLNDGLNLGDGERVSAISNGVSVPFRDWFYCARNYASSGFSSGALTRVTRKVDRTGSGFLERQ